VRPWVCNSTEGKKKESLNIFGKKYLMAWEYTLNNILSVSVTL
jgi:hypothetical protein